MTQDSTAGNPAAERYGYLICARRHDGGVIPISLADDPVQADKEMAKHQEYHGNPPDLGNVRDLSLGEAFDRRDELAKWRRGHPVGERRIQLVAHFEVIELPRHVADLSTPT